MINFDELKTELEKHLISLNYSKEKIANILSSLDNDPIHNYEDYMSEYDSDVLIENKLYKKYNCWINNIGFKHVTYYLKADLYDESVDAYLQAHKIYEII